MKNILKYPLTLLFAVFILGFSVFDIIKPDKSFSELENKYLAQRPKFSWEELFNNKFSQKYETYTNEQFVGRDTWISIKSISETALGKVENNGIVFGKEHYMFEKYKTINEKQFEKNSEYTREFIKMYPKLPLTFTIIPSSYMVLSDYLPKGLENVNQNSLTKELMDSITAPNIKKLSFYDALTEHKDEYIYYRTDHHWTTLGAYYAYSAYVESLGKTPVSMETLEGIDVNDFYGTYYSKAKKKGTVPDIITYYDIKPKEVLIDEKPADGIYDLSKFEVRDKYAALLKGNNALMHIKSDLNQNRVEGETQKLLVIKDSFANSFVPYLMYNFDEIYVVDLRYYRAGLSKLIPEHEFIDVLLMYNFMNFESDANIAQLRY